ncbi:unnamed protein product [Rhizophagus irregularis]|nr:unnamed protein product [Rhizophagus irregularis]
MLSRKKITNWLEKLYLIQKISEGIKLIHDAGFLHCDIHSGNIFYENVSEIYISDFGISIPAYKVTSDTKFNGVLEYIAPEIVNGGTRSMIFYLMNTREDLAEEFRLKSQVEEENEVNDHSQYSKIQEEENKINQSKDSLTSKLSFKEALISTYSNSYDGI